VPSSAVVRGAEPVARGGEPQPRVFTGEQNSRRTTRNASALDAAVIDRDTGELSAALHTANSGSTRHAFGSR